MSTESLPTYEIPHIIQRYPLTQRKSLGLGGVLAILQAVNKHPSVLLVVALLLLSIACTGARSESKIDRNDDRELRAHDKTVVGTTFPVVFRSDLEIKTGEIIAEAHYEMHLDCEIIRVELEEGFKIVKILREFEMRSIDGKQTTKAKFVDNQFSFIHGINKEAALKRLNHLRNEVERAIDLVFFAKKVIRTQGEEWDDLLQPYVTGIIQCLGVPVKFPENLKGHYTCRGETKYEGVQCILVTSTSKIPEIRAEVNVSYYFTTTLDPLATVVIATIENVRGENSKLTITNTLKYY